MRFITFVHDSYERAGVLVADASGDADAVFDLAAPCMGAPLGAAAPQVGDLVAAGLGRIACAIADHGLRQEARLTLADVSLRAPIPRPRRIFGIAYNYRDALRERGVRAPAAPVVFLKDPATVIGPGQAVVLPPDVGGITYEAELAVVIGRAGRDIGVADALSHVAACGVFNDVSASELIRKDGGFHRGKNLPTFGPFGPFLATVDEFADLQQLAVRLEMDGATLQDSTTADMLFGVAELVSFLSREQALEAGDVIATGTPAGVAPARKPPTWIRPGARLRASVQGLGTLCNPAIKGAPYLV